MRDTLVLLGALLWLAATALWLFPRKRALLRKHGPRKNGHDLVRLAMQDQEAWKLHRDSWIMLGVGLVAVLALVATR